MARLTLKKIDFVVANKLYDNGIIRNVIKSKNAISVIPYKGVYLPNDSTLTPDDFYDNKIYRKRHIVERVFGRLKENKKMVIRFDKLDSSFLSFISLASLNYFVNTAIVFLPTKCSNFIYF